MEYNVAHTNGHLKPPLDVTYDHIPAELRDIDHWVGWRLEPDEKRPGEFIKKPYQLNGNRGAKSNDNTTWASFEAAVAASQAFNGIGFMLSGSGYTCIDLDKVLDPATGRIESRALDIVRQFNSYTEISQSGQGLHIFVRGTISNDIKESDALHVEVYSNNRYIAMTGRLLDGCNPNIEDHNGTTQRFAGQVRVDAAVVKLIHKDSKASPLWDGDTSAYGGDDSAADLALCGYLAKYTKGDRAAIDRLFRRSKLMRDKWLRDDYRERTIGKAIEGQTATKKLPPIRLLTLKELADRPPPEWLVGDYLVEKSVAVLYGAPGSLKTFIALGMALAVATGTSWNGADTRRGPVVYIAGESQSDLYFRARAWAIHNKVQLPDESGFYVIEHAVPLMDDEWLNALNDVINLQEIHSRLIVVDTLSRSMTGANENATEDMGTYMQNVGALKDETGATVLLIHHTNKGGGYRGNSNLLAYTDTMLRVDRPDKGRSLTIKCEKQRTNEDGWQKTFTSYKIEFCDGTTGASLGRDSLVVGEEDPDAEHSDGLTVDEQRLYEALRKHPNGLTAEDWMPLSVTDRTRFYKAKGGLEAKQLVFSSPASQRKTAGGWRRRSR